MLPQKDRMRVAVVGPCASGKSTVVEQLRRWGYDAFSVGQEHSVIQSLWRRRSPDALVFLHVDFPTLQARRGASWPKVVYDEQLERLRDARSHATVEIDTGAASIPQTLARISAALERRTPER